jgi:hypothetical protein
LFFYFGEHGGGRNGRTAGEVRGLIVETGPGTGWETAGRTAAGGLIWKNKTLQGQVFGERRGSGGLLISHYLARREQGAGGGISLLPLPGAAGKHAL